MSKIYNISIDKFVNDCGEEEPGWEKSFTAGWKMCKAEILKEIKENHYQCNNGECVSSRILDIIEEDF